ncbi:hypothetical protein BVG16_07370 [Paenibacillus selenitireducens]|uniref:DUF4127 domain-containing protein n=1 Tax=Paenibacillus selenitireducens TaxID=1324314 RepID=A0A1T2XLC8_9BACL|nr:DUF4127 family protein [Paenibacillus selenitireducens]OPA80536.1 hypothetical protein BVG16_07370 [Paenibacillus selenitireducens]
MKKIVFIPLDERPCNYYFPTALAEGTEFAIVTPPLEMMGLKKKPADVERLWSWLLEEAADADGAIVSIDTLIYGGIVPSRLHQLSRDTCEERIHLLRKLKQVNPNLKLFAFNLIMRCPKYSSADEEPDYYEEWGREIFLQGYIKHRLELGISTDDEHQELREIESLLPSEHLDDYIQRRAINVAVNKMGIGLVQEKVIDFMIVPQDDSAPYGLTAINQQQVRNEVKHQGVQLSVYMYPGADEVGCTLLARMMNEMKGRKPLLYPRFSSVQGPYVTPLYEDRVLFESVKYQILAAGGLIAASFQEADAVLCINAPGDTMQESNSQHQPNRGYQVLRNLVELTETVDFVIHTLKKPCIVADVAFANGADLELLYLLREKNVLFELAGYAAWNTSSNTLGTCIAQGMIYQLYGNTAEHRHFLGLRMVEDAGYCASVRRAVQEEVLPSLGYTYFEVDGQRGQVACAVRSRLEQFVRDHLNDPQYKIVLEDCYLPWSRMFEVGLTIRVLPYDDK